MPGLPQGEIHLEALKVNEAADDAQIRLLGYPEDVKYRINDDYTLTIQPPEVQPDQLVSEHAVIFKLTGFDLGLNS